jgi:formate dehydrogenase subunit beta
MRAIIPVENGETLAAIQRFLQKLLQTETVEALLVPMRTPAVEDASRRSEGRRSDRGAITPALVSDPALLSSADPLAPVMPNNGATLAGQLSVREPRARVGVVLRACELRALVELVKLKQASLENLTLIAVDCAGTYELPVYYQHLAQEAGPEGERSRSNGRARQLWPELYQTAATEPEASPAELRLACRMCEQPVYAGADITLELLGSDLAQAIYISLPEALGEKLGLSAIEGHTNGRTEVLERLVAARQAVREAEFAAIHRRLEGNEGLTGVFDRCIRCHNCMTVCPICYCKTCVFKSAVFDYEPRQYLTWARQKGACRLPADTTLFHLTRLNHMGLSCVGCGMCTQACPAELPVGLVFRAIGQRLQETFQYHPGRSPDEPLPLITFQEDEWTELGEE